MTSNAVRNEMMTNVIGHNKHMTREYLVTLRDSQLLGEVHPMDRKFYADRSGIPDEDRKKNQVFLFQPNLRK